MASMMIAYFALLTIRPWNQFTRIAPRIVEVMEAGDEGDQRPHLGLSSDHQPTERDLSRQLSSCPTDRFAD